MDGRQSGLAINGLSTSSSDKPPVPAKPASPTSAFRGRDLDLSPRVAPAPERMPSVPLDTLPAPKPLPLMPQASSSSSQSSPRQFIPGLRQSVGAPSQPMAMARQMSGASFSAPPPSAAAPPIPAPKPVTLSVGAAPTISSATSSSASSSSSSPSSSSSAADKPKKPSVFKRIGSGLNRAASKVLSAASELSTAVAEAGELPENIIKKRADQLTVEADTLTNTGRPAEAFSLLEAAADLYAAHEGVGELDVREKTYNMKDATSYYLSLALQKYEFLLTYAPYLPPELQEKSKLRVEAKIMSTRQELKGRLDIVFDEKFGYNESRSDKGGRLTFLENQVSLSFESALAIWQHVQSYGTIMDEISVIAAMGHYYLFFNGSVTALHQKYSALPDNPNNTPRFAKYWRDRENGVVKRYDEIMIFCPHVSISREGLATWPDHDPQTTDQTVVSDLSAFKALLETIFAMRDDAWSLSSNEQGRKMNSPWSRLQGLKLLLLKKAQTSYLEGDYADAYRYFEEIARLHSLYRTWNGQDAACSLAYTALGTASEYYDHARQLIQHCTKEFQEQRMPKILAGLQEIEQGKQKAETDRSAHLKAEREQKMRIRASELECHTYSASHGIASGSTYRPTTHVVYDPYRTSSGSHSAGYTTSYH